MTKPKEDVINDDVVYVLVAMRGQANVYDILSDIGQRNEDRKMALHNRLERLALRGRLVRAEPWRGLTTYEVAT